MPWHIEKRNDEYCVIPDAGGAPAGCHATRAEAEAQIAALYAQEPEAEKAGRRVRGDKVGLLAELKAAWDKFWAWANYEDQPKAEPAPPSARPQPTGLKLYTGPDGQAYLLIWTTNAFIDRDRETFATKAIEDYVARHAGDTDLGQFDFWHVPGSEFGSITAQAVVGRFLVEAGTFDDTVIGQAFKAFLQQHPTGHPTLAAEGWGASHQFAYDAQRKRPDGTFEHFEKSKSTVLPLAAAANPWTTAEVIMAMTDEQQAAFATIGQEVGVPDLAERIMAEGAARTKALEEAGVAHKSAAPDAAEPAAAPVTAEQPAAEPAVAEAPPVPAAMDEQAVAQAVIAAVGPLVEEVKGLAATVAAEQAARAALAAELATLRTAEDQRLKAVAATTPAASLAALITAGLQLPARAVGAPEARIDGRTKEARGPKETPSGGGTGIGLIDGLVAGSDWRDMLPGRA